MVSAVYRPNVLTGWAASQSSRVADSEATGGHPCPCVGRAAGGEPRDVGTRPGSEFSASPERSTSIGSTGTSSAPIRIGGHYVNWMGTTDKRYVPPADFQLRVQCEAVVERQGKTWSVVRFESLRGDEWARVREGCLMDQASNAGKRRRTSENRPSAIRPARARVARSSQAQRRPPATQLWRLSGESTPWRRIRIAPTSSVSPSTTLALPETVERVARSIGTPTKSRTLSRARSARWTSRSARGPASLRTESTRSLATPTPLRGDRLPGSRQRTSPRGLRDGSERGARFGTRPQSGASGASSNRGRRKPSETLRCAKATAFQASVARTSGVASHRPCGALSAPPNADPRLPWASSFLRAATEGTILSPDVAYSA